jgi:uncharacterized HAD superfamily protein
MEDRGLRYNEGKTRLDLITPFPEEQQGKVMTGGSIKYLERNWERGMRWSKVIASLKRHLLAVEYGEDYDKESGQLHSAHIAVNANFLTQYYKTYPEGDDRPRFPEKRIGLDIDGVIANFSDAFQKRFGLNLPVHHWEFTYAWRDHKHKLVDDEEFWFNIEPLIEGKNLPFEPICYCTNRLIGTRITEQWLEKNNFPCKPVITVNGGKVEKLKEQKLDIFVDDNYDTFIELNNAGICTYLWDRPHNQKYNVGHKRLHSLNDLVTWR